MSLPCILSLHSNVGIIKQKREVIAYLVRNYFTNPGQTSELYEPLMISFLNGSSIYGSAEALSQEVSGKLSRAIKRFYPDDGIRVYCTPKQNANNTYNLELKIELVDGATSSSIFIDQLITVDESGNIIINFTGSY